MKIKVLGTGTSQGIPVIACDCAVCTSNDSRDHRLRCSLYIEINQVK
ncbi:MAG: MBL fold metallo-hydrolase, partial [Bacteroidota bacterium]